MEFYDESYAMLAAATIEQAKKAYKTAADRLINDLYRKHEAKILDIQLYRECRDFFLSSCNGWANADGNVILNSVNKELKIDVKKVEKIIYEFENRKEIKK